MGRVLVVEDDERLTRLIVRALQGAGLGVSCAGSGTDGLALALAGDFDLVVLDLMLPGLPGDEVLRRLVRDRGDQPVLVLSAMADIDVRVGCLDAGADDFLAKPFTIAELLARVRLRMRSPGAGVVGRSLSVGSVCLDMRLQRATVDGRNVELSGREFSLLKHLMERGGLVCTRNELLSGVWGPVGDANGNVLDVCVRRLRGKLGARWVQTVRNVGYRFVTD
jgi:two-component system, OmpR family, response regulator